METMLSCLGMSWLDLILYFIQVIGVALIIGLPVSLLLIYGLHLIDCIKEPSRNDWKFWR